jgi:hypothetical protein|tara:strand:- start:158 stop:385 length:228 start_codon:yes stop_codon:yes gene_type:complete
MISLIIKRRTTPEEEVHEHQLVEMEFPLYLDILRALRVEGKERGAYCRAVYQYLIHPTNMPKEFTEEEKQYVEGK